jgi:hypothetical protein
MMVDNAPLNVGEAIVSTSDAEAALSSVDVAASCARAGLMTTKAAIEHTTVIPMMAMTISLLFYIVLNDYK